MSRFINHTAAALAALIIMATSFSAVTSVPANTAVAIVAAPALA